MISVGFQGKPFNITVIQVYTLTSNAEEAEVERFCEDLHTRPSRTNTPKRCAFHFRGLECRSRKSRNTWSNRQIWPWSKDIKKRWQEYTEELYKKDLHNPDNYDGMITHLEPDILECEVKWALGCITMNKASGGDRIPVELLQTLKEML